MNFAEAALLIQGSACIYSKKVSVTTNLVNVTVNANHVNSKEVSDIANI